MKGKEEMGFLEVLTIIFVVLKLTSVIDWSWWLIFSPMYVAIVLYTVIIAIQIRVWKNMDNSHSGFVKRMNKNFDKWENK